MIRKFAKSNYKENLMKLSGVTDEVRKTDNLEAHHIIPQSVHGRLKAMRSQINPNHPALLTWWQKGLHQSFSSEINARWQRFLDAGPTDDEILEFAREIAEDYQQYYYNHEYYLELYQVVSESAL